MPFAVFDESEIERLLFNAQYNIISLEQVKSLIKGELTEIPGDNENFLMFVPPNHKVVYTHEEQPSGVCRHLSVSSDDEYPALPIVEVLLEKFKFINALKDCIVWRERIGDSDIIAINIMEPLDGNWAKHKKENSNETKL